MTDDQRFEAMQKELGEPVDGVRPALADLLPPLAVDGAGGEGEPTLGSVN